MVVLALGETSATGLLEKTPHDNSWLGVSSWLFCFHYFPEYVESDAFLGKNGRTKVFLL